MKRKLDELTYIGGNNIRDFVFKFNITIIGLISVIGLIEAVTTGDGVIGDMHILVGIMPFALIGLIYPIQIYTLNYFQKTRFHMIDLKDVYMYHIKEFYNIKNISVFLITALIYDLVVAYYLGIPAFGNFIEIASGFAISPLFVSIGFFITTVYSKGYHVLRIALYVLTYVLLVPVIVVSVMFNSFYILPILLVMGVISIFAFSYIIKIQDRKLEV